MNIQIFGTKKCFDTKKAERYFKERGIKAQVIDLKEKGMSKGELTAVIQAVKGLDNLLDPKCKDQDTLTLMKYLADEDKLEKVLENQQILKTPIVRNGKLATLVFGYRMKGSVLLFIAVWLLTMVSMFSIGLMIASLCRTTKSMNVVTSVVYFPMLLFSGATIPAEVFPKGMRFFADILPLGVGINSLKMVSLGVYEGLLIPVLVLTAITIVCTAISIKTFRWE